jgi:GNAT superfamily N-acetyltransferase
VHADPQPTEYRGYVIAVEEVSAAEQDALGVPRARRQAMHATARLGGQLVAVCRVFERGSMWMDGGMFIAPPHRGGFLAVRLAEFVTEWARTAGASQMFWECESDTNSGAIARYLGYREFSRRYVVDFKEQAR